jgi:hypothetical protein
MWAGRVEAHAGPMFNSYDMNRALVAERQNQLLGEARQTRLGRRARKARRANPEERTVRSLSTAAPDRPWGVLRHEEPTAA